MSISTIELAKAKDAANSLLEQLDLEAFLFELEPKAEGWALKVECAIDGGWQVIALDVDAERLAASLVHDTDRQILLQEWRRHLGACKVKLP